MDQAEQTGDSGNPPTKRQRVESSVTVTVSGEAFSMTAEAFGRLEGFVADKIAHSEKKTRNPIVKKQEGRYEINRGAAEFQILRAYLEGKPLSKIRDVDKKKKVLKEAKFFSFPDADYEQLTGAISLPTFKGSPERHFLKSTVEEARYEQVCINKKYVVGAGPEQVSVWSTTSKQLLYTFQVPRNGHRRHTLILSRSPADLSFLFTASGENISVFNLESGTKILNFTPSSIPSSSSSSSSSSDSSTTDSSTTTTETTTSSNGSSPSPSSSSTSSVSSSSTLPPHAPSPTQIAYKNNKILMCTTSGKETSVHFFSLSLFVSPATWEKTVSFTRESGARVTCCDFYQNAEGNFIAVLGCEDGNVQVYNLSTTPPTQIKTIEDAHYSKDNHSTYSANSPSPSSAVTHVRIKRDLPHLVSSGCDGSVAIWDLAKDCKVLQRFDTGLKLGVHALDLDDDDAICLFGAAHDFNVRVHDLLSGEHLKTACMDEKRSARFDVHSVGYCGDFVVAGVSDSRVRLLKWRRE